MGSAHDDTAQEGQTKVKFMRETIPTNLDFILNLILKMQEVQ